MKRLRDLLPRSTFAVAAAYSGDEIDAYVASAVLGDDDTLELRFPKGHCFFVGTAVTIHLDNRIGSESFTEDLGVLRCSYKGRVVQAELDRIEVVPIQYQLFFSNRIVAEFSEQNYAFPQETRPMKPLPATPLLKTPSVNDRERENKLGVWVTRANERPHTTVMAFLSTPDDDVFLISHQNTFKSQMIHRDRRCVFAIDHRASWVFEKAIDWNFTILTATAHLVPKEHPIFPDIQALFVEKNPWEQAFFMDPKVEMFHLRPERILMADLR